MKEITERCQIVLNEPDVLPSTLVAQRVQQHSSSLVFLEESHLSTALHDESTLHSTQNPTSSSRGSSGERTLDSEDTHLSTQMPSPPSHGSDNEDDLLSESSISRKEQSVERGHRVLNLIHEIRARRINTGETDWDATSFRDSGEFYESEIVPRDHFDDTIFDLVNRFDIIHLLIECNSIIERIGNLNHVSLTHTYLSKLTHFIISETGFFGEIAAHHLGVLLSVVPDPGEIVSTVFPLLRNAFHRSNENACYSLLCIVIKELEMDVVNKVILRNLTESDWIAVFSHRWADHHSLGRADLYTFMCGFVHMCGFLTNQHRRNILFVITLCHAAMNERLPSSIHDTLVHSHHTDPSFSTISLLFMIDQSNSQISRFLPSFPADIVIERELSRMLLLFDDHCVKKLSILCNLFANHEPLLFLHPFILREEQDFKYFQLYGNHFVEHVTVILT
ncbi:hypothetical protein BLNAU_1441 [Blattamonas nauphoetae]|uniref:Uncharacterized protein n=1 Tax=Blattamonas nauphoetae TaxID=2049346 RepID=A0ABQ9YI12_9EUKA|nr:hypothetical protein BLNAU_1441 [Blattamonas nauphoetae]